MKISDRDSVIGVDQVERPRGLIDAMIEARRELLHLG
jgi:hypothetical protein